MLGQSFVSFVKVREFLSDVYLNPLLFFLEKKNSGKVVFVNCVDYFETCSTELTNIEKKFIYTNLCTDCAENPVKYYKNV